MEHFCSSCWRMLRSSFGGRLQILVLSYLSVVLWRAVVLEANSWTLKKEERRGGDKAHADHSHMREYSFLCRRCGHSVLHSSNLLPVPTPLAKSQRNETLPGRRPMLVQHFVNPAGQHFDVITASEATVTAHGQPVEEHSWFPHFAWQFALCPRCHAHLGWVFRRVHDEDESILSSFTGLIREHLIHDDLADTLVMSPQKTYM